MAAGCALTFPLPFSHINVILRQILTHSYSRVVMKALLHAHKRKRISVYVTEGRSSIFLTISYLSTRGFKLNHEDWGKLSHQVNKLTPRSVTDGYSEG